MRELYTRRCRREAEEMTAHAQAAELLSQRIGVGDSVLDVGCGSGYFYHSLAGRNLPVEYWGLDACGALIDIGRDIPKDLDSVRHTLQLKALIVMSADGKILTSSSDAGTITDEIRKKHGELDIAVQLIRETRAEA